MKHDPKKEQMWQELIQGYNDEEMPVKKYCEMHNVKEHQFYYWQKKFKQPPSDTPTFIKVKPESSHSPIKHAIWVELSDMRIKVPLEFNASHLKKLLKVIKSID